MIILTIIYVLVMIFAGLCVDLTSSNISELYPEYDEKFLQNGLNLLIPIGLTLLYWGILYYF